jgi:putative ATP-binding cassette transporter
MDSQKIKIVKKRHPVRTVLKELVLPYWTRSEERWKARGLLLLTLVLILGMVYSLVLLNRWNKAFYDALQNLNKENFLIQLRQFFIIALSYSLIMAYKYYILQSLGIGWRKWVTEKNLTHWLSDKNFYYWQITKTSDDRNGQDNPDQRLSEDIHELTDLSLEISEKVLREFITFVSFIGILWGLSSSIKLTNVMGYDFEIHRYLVWVCLLYAAIGTWLIHKIGRPLSKINFMQQKLEADFRYFLVRLRENSESVALLNGEHAEKQKLSTNFFQVVGNFKELISCQKKLIMTTNIYGQLAYIFPFIVASPKVFTREITLGQLFQISSAFGQVQGSVSVFVDMYAKIARLHSVFVRLGGFLLSLEEHRELRHETVSRNVQTTAGPYELQSLNVMTPQKQSLFPALSLTLPPGKRVLITAPSGKGKTSLLRSMNGLWPYFSGQVHIPLKSHRLALTQKAYLPIGSLRAALAYPMDSGAFNDQDYQRVLTLTKLSYLDSALDQKDNWSLRLSSGEQQRIALARIFLQKPDMVFLDEATSAIEKETEKELYEALLTNFPQMILVSFSHEETTLGAFHQECLKL